MKKILDELDKSNVELSKSLWEIQSSLAVYSVIALNASKIETGKRFFGFIQKQQIEQIAVGFSKVFEEGKKYRKYRLNSVPSIIRFIDEHKIGPTNPRALSNYLAHWKIEKGDAWTLELQALLKNQYTKHILRIKEVRDKHIAHSEAGVDRKDLPSFAVFEELLGIACRFHNFVNSAFLNVSSHLILTDTQVKTSLIKLLQETGLSDVTTEFQD